MKMLKSKKALSPVVAAIILIAVTVAVSLAVAIWMGSLTTGQMQTEGLAVINHVWATPSGETIPSITLTVRNTGATDLSIAEIRVDESAATVDKTLPYELKKGHEEDFEISIADGFARGTTYRFYFRTSRGNVFGPYTIPAP